MEINLGDVVRLRKKHPCGSDEWQVVRLGADIRIKCLGCHRRVLLERGTFERETFSTLLDLADLGIARLIRMQKELLKSRSMMFMAYSRPDRS